MTAHKIRNEVYVKKFCWRRDGGSIKRLSCQNKKNRRQFEVDLPSKTDERVMGGHNFVRASILVDADSPEPRENQVDVDDLADVACQKKIRRWRKIITRHRKFRRSWVTKPSSVTSRRRNLAHGNRHLTGSEGTASNTINTVQVWNCWNGVHNFTINQKSLRFFRCGFVVWSRSWVKVSVRRKIEDEVCFRDRR